MKNILTKYSPLKIIFATIKKFMMIGSLIFKKKTKTLAIN
jgi:hypothetical protein